MVTEPAPQAHVRQALRAGIPLRLLLVGGLLVLEKLLLGLLVDYQSAAAQEPPALALRLYQSRGFHFGLVLAAALALFVGARDGAGWRTRLFPGPDAAVRRSWCVVHLLLLALLLPTTFFLYRDGVQPVPFGLRASLAVVLTVAAAVAAAAAIAPLSRWRRAAVEVGGLWAYAGFAALAGTMAIAWSESLWPIAARATFVGVQAVLQPLLPDLQVDPQQLILATGHFSVFVSTACSGLEGAGLMLVFCAAWLLCFRSEYRFPRALLLIPVGVALSLVLNVLRIAALVLIGHVGHPGVAIYGFHSQAGWIAFTAAAMALAYFSRRSPWMNRHASALRTPAHNPAAAFLMPFLALLAAGMLAHALSSGFEYLYALRLLGCGAAFWVYRRSLLALDWRCSWRGALAGAVVFVVWSLLAHVTLPPVGAPAALAQLPAPLAGTWLVLRTVSAVIAVPVAEELAYRGYLLRRWRGAAFESFDYAAVRGPALLATALVFGLSHGVMWPAGVVAGLVYGALAIRLRSLGESVLAHATTNALLAAQVLLADRWQYW